MEFTILGPTQMLVDNRPVPLGEPKQRQLLAWLLYRVGEPVRAEMLAEQLWPHGRWPDTRKVLHQHMSRLRAVLARAGLPGVLAVSTGQHYRLDIDPDLVDYHRFVRLTRQARLVRDEPRAAADLLTQALDLWRDELFAELHTDAAERLRTQLTDTLWLQACLMLVDCQLALGDARDAVPRMEPLLLRYEADQTVAAQWMTVLIADHRARDAVSFFTRFRERLGRDGDQPGQDLIRLYESAQHAPRHPIARPVDEQDRPRPSQLRRDLHDFIGRQDALAELDALVGVDPTAPVVTVDGMPGSGKTAFAIHWANRHRDLYPDGNLFIDARGYGQGDPLSPGEVLGRFLHAFGVPTDRIPVAEPDRGDLLNQILARRKVLIVIDNVRDHEHLLPMLTTAPGCLTIATSRARLSELAITVGAHCLTVPALHPVDRTELLARRLGPRADEDHEALAELSRLTGGLPLAVRIAAEHVRERPGASLVELVEDLRRRLIADRGSTTNLYTVFSWSYQALDAECRSLFRRLALAPTNTFSSQAAAALMAEEPARVEQMLNRLAMAHLLDHAPHQRYQVHDLLHQYAGNLAEAEDSGDDRHAALGRLLDWTLLSANNAATALAPARTPVPGLPDNSVPSAQVFDSDSDALTWAERERDAVMALTHQAARYGFHMRAWQIPNTVHEIFERYASQEDILASLETALDSAQKSGVGIAVIGTLNNFGTVCFAVHDYARGASCFDQALQLARRSNNLEAQAVCLHNLARFRLEIGNIADAIALYHEALDIFRGINQVRNESFSLHRLGEAHRRLGQYDSALTFYQQALRLRERIGFIRGQAATHSQLAGLRLEMGQADLAAAHCQQALTTAERVHDDGIACDALLVRAALHRLVGDSDRARADARAALRLAAQMADPQRQAQANEVLVTLASRVGEATDPSVRFDQQRPAGQTWPDNAPPARRRDEADLQNRKNSSTSR